jgi:hypothetical protein
MEDNWVWEDNWTTETVPGVVRQVTNKVITGWEVCRTWRTVTKYSRYSWSRPPALSVEEVPGGTRVEVYTVSGGASDESRIKAEARAAPVRLLSTREV